MNGLLGLRDFEFGEPQRLLLLWALLPLGFVLVWAARRARRTAANLLSPLMSGRLATTSARAGSATRGVLLILGIGMLLVAAAKPRFGFRYEEVKRRGADLVVAIDVSRSMLSRDVSPNRLERAKTYVRDLLKKVRGDRVALVGFAGKAVPLCPLTVDQGFFGAALDDLSPESAPRGGTAIGDAIRSALDLLERDPDRDAAIVLITDGEDHESFPLEAAALARERGVKVFAVGIGDPGEGAKVPGKDDRGVLAYEGKEVVSKMDETLLTKIALETSGAYVPARTGVYDFGQVYVEHLMKLRAAELATEKRRRFVEQYQWFAAAGLILLALARLVSPLKRRSVVLAPASGTVATGASPPSPPSPPNSSGPSAPTNRNRPVAVVLVLAGLLFAPPAARAESAEPDVLRATGINGAVELLAQGKAKEALDLLDLTARVPDTSGSVGSEVKDGETKPPQSPRFALARGAALAALGRQDDARSAYEIARAGSDPETTLRARFNLGHLDVASGKEALGATPEEADQATREKALAAFDLARDHFRAALDLDPKRDEARRNLDLLRLYVKNLKDVWRRRDEAEAQKKKEEEPYLDQIERMWKEEQAIGLAARQDAGVLGAAALADLGSRQKVVADDVPLLEKKMHDALEKQVAEGRAPAQDPKQIEALFQVVKGLGDRGTAAANSFAAGDVAAGSKDAATVEDGLAGLFLMLAQYERLVKKGLEIESDVVKALAPSAPDTGAAEVAGAAPAADVDADSAVAPDPEWETRRQNRIGPLAELLVRHAEETLPQLEANPPPQLPDGVDPKQKEALEKQLEDQKKKIEGLKESMRRAKEKAPAIPPLSSATVDAIGKDDRAGAHAKAEEIAKILAEIAEPLQDPDDKKDQDDKKQDDQDKKDDKKQQDDKKQDPEKQDPKDQKDPKDQQDPKDQKDPKDPKDQKDGEPQPQPKDLTQDKIEQLLKQTKDREKEFEKKKRKLLEALAVPVPVEKDW